MPLLTSNDCFKRYGDPTLEKHMVLWDIPSEMEIGVIPKRIYCNKDMLIPLTLAFKALINNEYVNELKTFDGCFNIRKKKAGRSLSLHAWGVAIDVNAAWNGFNKKPTLSEGFVKCFTENGFDWGGLFSKPDGMHFQLKK